MCVLLLWGCDLTACAKAVEQGVLLGAIALAPEVKPLNLSKTFVNSLP